MENEITENEMAENEINKRIQKIALDILLEIDKVCRQIGVKYTMTSGTLLGAVRHKGFIPWDDDVDIAMTYDNYVKFREEAPKLLPEHIKIQDHTNCKDYTLMYAKAFDIRTTCVENLYSELDSYYNAIWVDIFPIYRMRDNKNVIKKLWRNKIKSDGFRASRSKINIKRKKGIIIKLAMQTARLISKMCGAANLTKHFVKAPIRENNKNGTVTFADCINFQRVMPYDWFTDYADYEFEGHKIMGIKNADAYLSTVYGNYMELPPVEKRKGTHFGVFKHLDLDKPCLEYKKEQKQKK